MVQQYRDIPAVCYWLNGLNVGVSEGGSPGCEG